MSTRGYYSGGKARAALYSREQVEGVLNSLGVEIDGETMNDFLCFCPIHGNRLSPSLSVSKESGTYICFNPSCNASGTFIDFVKEVGRKDEFQARRLIIKCKVEGNTNFADQLAATFKKQPDFVEFPQTTLDRMYEDFWQSEQAIQYMETERGFTQETLRHFKIGYSAKKNLIAVPMHDPKGMPVGVIGRTIGADKRFANSKKLPTSKTLWNLHRAKRTGDSVIITEASFDAMRVHQAGLENVVACLGGNFSPHHFDLLDKTFSTIILMTDFDPKEKHTHENCAKCANRGFKLCHGHNPGRDLGVRIAAGLHRKKILWASYDYRTIYPDGAKDAGDMSDEQIRQCVKNAVTNMEYQSWNLY